MLSGLGARHKQAYKRRNRPNVRYGYVLPALVLVLLCAVAWHRGVLSPAGTRFHETTLRLVVVKGSWDHLPSLCFCNPQTTAAREAVDKAKSLGPPADCTIVVAVGDGLAGDVELARWATGYGGYEEEPPLDFSAITLSRRDLESAQARGGMDLLASSHLPLVAANLFSARTNQHLRAPYRIVSCTGHAVAILALAEELDSPDVRVEEPVTSLRTQLEQVANKAHIVLLLSNASLQVDTDIAFQVGAIDILVSADRDPAREPEILPHTNTLLVSPAYEGQSVGVAGLTLDRRGRLIRYAWDRVPLALH